MINLESVKVTTRPAGAEPAGSGLQQQRNCRLAKNYRSKSVWTLFQRKLFNNQTVWPVIFGFTGPICARALKSFHLLELRAARASRLASKAANAENDESTPTMGGIVSRYIDE